MKFLETFVNYIVKIIRKQVNLLYRTVLEETGAVFSLKSIQKRSKNPNNFDCTFLKLNFRHYCEQFCVYKDLNTQA